MTIETVFGTVKMTETQPNEFLNSLVSDPQEGPEWVAEFVDGNYKGISEQSWAQSKALKQLIATAAAKYSAELQDQIDGI